MKKTYKLILLAMIFGLLAGTLASLIVFKITTSENNLAKDYYRTETLLHVSPHHLRKAMDKGDNSFILVDLRSPEEYENEHIVGAINIPAYRDPDTSAYSDVERIVKMFDALPKDKDIIVYCYSIPCMTGRKIGKMLAEHGILVQQLGIGWNEWRYYWDLWNHEHEWNVTNVKNYIINGTEPGIIKQNINKTESCSIKGEYGC